ncbi:MAG: PD-(D/E)XK nuclease family protein [Myxococcota bacterium]
MLGKRREAEIIPSYSLTGDLLSYLRCGLQYRYYNGSSLPPSRPVQLWFGEFIHGVMETAYRRWKGSMPAFPWPMSMTEYREKAPPGRVPHDVGTIGDLVESTLRAAGKFARSGRMRNSAYRRAHKAVNEIGPALFPLIESAEEKVIGTRPIVMPAGIHARSSMYELHGVMDVLSSISKKEVQDSFLRDAVLSRVGSADDEVDVIVDYKGTRRPAHNSEYWLHGDWQLQMYAWLRSKQPVARPVVAGILLYINELDPGSSDMAALVRDVKKCRTDVVPDRGARDGQVASIWKSGDSVPALSREFRLARMMRVVEIDQQSMHNAVAAFDQVVVDIETSVAREAASGRISGNWLPYGDDRTCRACDFRHFCPAPHESRGRAGYEPGAPQAP